MKWLAMAWLIAWLMVGCATEKQDLPAPPTRDQLPTPLDPFWRGESTNRPEQSLERDIQDLRRRNLEELRKR